MQIGKQRQQLELFHLLHIFCYLKKVVGGNKAWTILVRQRKTSISDIHPDEVHIQTVSGPSVTSKLNKHNIQFTRDEEGNIYVKTSKYDTDNQPKKATFKYEQEGRFCLGVANIEIKNGTITGKQCPVLIIQGER